VAKQQFQAPVGHVAGNDLHVHQYWPDTAPPDDPAKSVVCWQCGRLTWKFTPVCIHCGVRLTAQWFARLVARLAHGMGGSK
jgi:hypothetical protein